MPSKSRCLTWNDWGTCRKGMSPKTILGNRTQGLGNNSFSQYVGKRMELIGVPSEKVMPMKSHRRFQEKVTGSVVGHRRVVIRQAIPVLKRTRLIPIPSATPMIPAGTCFCQESKSADTQKRIPANATKATE